MNVNYLLCSAARYKEFVENSCGIYWASVIVYVSKTTCFAKECLCLFSVYGLV